MQWFRTTELAEIFSSELRRQGKTPAWLSRQSGLAPATITRLLKGQRSPAAATVKRVAEALGLTYDWRENRAGVDDDHPLASEGFWGSVEIGSAHILIEPPTYNQSIAAADWAEVETAEVEHADVVQQGLFRVRVSGDCMAPRFPDGCTVEFRLINLAERRIEPGAPYYVQHADGRATFKLAHPADGGLELRPINYAACPRPLYVEWQNVARMARAAGIYTPI